MPTTPYSYRTLQGGAAGLSVPVPYPFISRAHVQVFANLSLSNGTYDQLYTSGTDYNWINDGQITMVVSTVGKLLTVKRTTPNDAPLVSWTDGSNVDMYDLLIADKQNLYTNQEQDDTSTLALANSETALDQIADALPYTPVGTVAGIPTLPTNGQRIEISNSVGIESFSPLIGRPSGFVGASDLTVRLIYTTSGSAWRWVDYRAVNPDGRYAGINFTQSGAGAVSRSVTSKLRDAVISVKDFGAVGDGITNDTAAIQAACSASAGVLFPSGTYKISSSTTFLATHSIRMLPGASLTVDSGVTVYFYAELKASASAHLFKGLGSVVGLGEVYPEWFGAVGNGTTDDAAAFNKTIPCVKASTPSAGNGAVRLQGKNYLLNSSWVVEQTAGACIDIIGTGTLLGDTRLLGGVAFTGALVNIQGSTDNLTSIVDFRLSGFALICQNIGKGQGLVFNTVNNNRLNGLQQSLVENIYIDNFQQSLYIRNTRLVKFSRISVWNNGIDGSLLANANACVVITDGSPGEFDVCGDQTFENCQFINTKQFYSKLIQINAQSPNSATPPAGKTKITVAGFRFTECIFYQGGYFGVELTATSHAQMGDFWFTNCQFDNTTGLRIRTLSANALIFNINYKGNYNTQVEGSVVRLEGFTSGNVNSINIASNYCAGVVNSAAVVAEKVDGINVIGNRWSGVNWVPGAGILFVDCNHVICNDNNMGRAGEFLAGSFVNMIAFQGTGNYYVATGNNSAGRATGALISNTTGASQVAIANNI